MSKRNYWLLVTGYWLLALTPLHLAAQLQHESWINGIIGCQKLSFQGMGGNLVAKVSPLTPTCNLRFLFYVSDAKSIGYSQEIQVGAYTTGTVKPFLKRRSTLFTIDLSTYDFAEFSRLGNLSTTFWAQGIGTAYKFTQTPQIEVERQGLVFFKSNNICTGSMNAVYSVSSQSSYIYLNSIYTYSYDTALSCTNSQVLVSKENLITGIARSKLNGRAHGLILNFPLKSSPTNTWAKVIQTPNNTTDLFLYDGIPIYKNTWALAGSIMRNDSLFGLLIFAKISNSTVQVLSYRAFQINNKNTIILRLIFDSTNNSLFVVGNIIYDPKLLPTFDNQYQKDRTNWLTSLRADILVTPLNATAFIVKFPICISINGPIQILPPDFIYTYKYLNNEINVVRNLVVFDAKPITAMGQVKNIKLAALSKVSTILNSNATVGGGAILDKNGTVQISFIVTAKPFYIQRPRPQPPFSLAVTGLFTVAEDIGQFWGTTIYLKPQPNSPKIDSVLSYLFAMGLAARIPSSMKPKCCKLLTQIINHPADINYTSVEITVSNFNVQTTYIGSLREASLSIECSGFEGDTPPPPAYLTK